MSEQISEGQRLAGDKQDALSLLEGLNISADEKAIFINRIGETNDLETINNIILEIRNKIESKKDF